MVFGGFSLFHFLSFPQFCRIYFRNFPLLSPADHGEVRRVVPKVGLDLLVCSGVGLLQTAAGQVELLAVEAAKGKAQVQLRGVDAHLQDTPAGENARKI